MNWIRIKEIEALDPSQNILVWQHNLSDPNSSRFQRAIYFSGIIKIYPIQGDNYYLRDKEYIGYDLEGDVCQITHFALVEAPKF